jgi:hypothetical protein
VCSERMSPADESKASPSGVPILTASRPLCGNALIFHGIF